MTIDQKRKRGAQPANTNAFKHGFYSRRLREISPQDLENAQNSGLKDEINLLRMVMLRLLEQATAAEDADLEDWQKTLAALGAASSRLATLLRTQQTLAKSSSDTLSLLSQALSEVTKDLNLDR